MPVSTGPLVHQPSVRSHGQYMPVAPFPHPGSSNRPSTGPLIRHPSMRPPPQPMPGASGSQAARGYGPQHALYGPSRQYWSNKAYNHIVPPSPPPPIETIMLDITALHEGGGSRKSRIHGTPFGVSTSFTLIQGRMLTASLGRVSLKENEMLMHKSQHQNLLLQHLNLLFPVSKPLIQHLNGAKMSS